MLQIIGQVMEKKLDNNYCYCLYAPLLNKNTREKQAIRLTRKHNTKLAPGLSSKHGQFKPNWIILAPNVLIVGRHCETNIDDCAAAPCLNGGRCVDEVAGYSCLCQPEYVGDRCSHHVCDSDQSPCLNGGTCYVEDNKARCRCSSAFTGDVCAHDKCVGVMCLNQGTCNNGVCICRLGEFRHDSIDTGKTCIL